MEQWAGIYDSLFDVLPSHLRFHWLVAIVFACVVAQTHVPNLYLHLCFCCAVGLPDKTVNVDRICDWSSVTLTTPG